MIPPFAIPSAKGCVYHRPDSGPFPRGVVAILLDGRYFGVRGLSSLAGDEALLKLL